MQLQWKIGFPSTLLRKSSLGSSTQRFSVWVSHFSGRWRANCWSNNADCPLPPTISRICWIWWFGGGVPSGVVAPKLFQLRSPLGAWLYYKWKWLWGLSIVIVGPGYLGGGIHGSTAPLASFPFHPKREMLRGLTRKVVAEFECLSVCDRQCVSECASFALCLQCVPKLLSKGRIFIGQKGCEIILHIVLLWLAYFPERYFNK